jgi:subtilisin family serine protease
MEVILMTGVACRNTGTCVTVIAFLAAIGCTSNDSTDFAGLDATFDVAATGTSDDFYYYLDQRIPIEIDPEAIIVSGTDLSEPEIRHTVSPVTNITAIRDRRVGAQAHKILSLGVKSRSAAASAVALLRASKRYAFVSNQYRLQESGLRVLPVNRLVVHFNEGVTAQQAASVSNALGLGILQLADPDSSRFEYLFSYPEPMQQSPIAFANALSEHPLVEWAHADRYSLDATKAGAPTDPLYGYQYYMKNNITVGGVPVDIDVERAWDLTKGRATTQVAVLDEGIDADLGTNVWENLGLYFDLWPCNFGDPDCKNVLDPADPHGTAVAGILVARHNAYGVAGVAPGVTIQPGRMIRDGDFGSDDEVAQAIDWAWNSAQSDVINGSWGDFAPNNPMTFAIQRAYSWGRGGKGTVLVFAAGNGAFTPVSYPATLTETIGVSAINRYGALAAYSRTGYGIDVVAPSSDRFGGCGAGDVSTADFAGPEGCNGAPNGDNNYMGGFSGTSAATPQVAGIAALLLQLEPNLTANQVKNRIRSGARYWGPPTQFGAGLVSAYRTLVPPPPPLSARITQLDVVPEDTYCTWEAIVSGGTLPYTYEWSGLLTGTGESVSGVIEENGNLYLTVTDADDDEDSDQLWIEVDPEAFDC